MNTEIIVRQWEGAELTVRPRGKSTPFDLDQLQSLSKRFTLAFILRSDGCVKLRALAEF
jgi:hypothetical protein